MSTTAPSPSTYPLPAALLGKFSIDWKYVDVDETRPSMRIISDGTVVIARIDENTFCWRYDLDKSALGTSRWYGSENNNNTKDTDDEALALCAVFAEQVRRQKCSLSQLSGDSLDETAKAITRVMKRFPRADLTGVCLDPDHFEDLRDYMSERLWSRLCSSISPASLEPVSTASGAKSRNDDVEEMEALGSLWDSMRVSFGGKSRAHTARDVEEAKTAEKEKYAFLEEKKAWTDMLESIRGHYGAEI